MPKKTDAQRIRDIANRMLEDQDSNVIFPSWDKKHPGAYDKAVRRAARAILAAEKDRVYTRVPIQDVGELLHYIADMM